MDPAIPQQQGHRISRLRLAGERVLVASRHDKAAIMQRPLAAMLGIQTWSPPDLDTDRFGTFSGEIERPGSPSEMLRAKISLAQEACPQSRFFMASEGSYGQHPALPMLALGEEWLMWLDAATGQAITERRCFTTRYYGAWRVENTNELRGRLSRCHLPALAVTLRALEANLPAAKGLRSDDEVLAAYAGLVVAGSPAAVLAIDMRAHLHLPRQRVLRRLAARLVHRLCCLCPGCSAPGFGKRQWANGLPCADCGAPTAQIAHRVDACEHCAYQSIHAQRPVPADPRWCDYCNP